MKKVFKIVSVVIALTLLMTGCSVTGIKSASVKSQAIEYLCEKYDAKPEEFELVDYRKAQIGFEEYMYFFQKPILVDYAFEFKYNGRNFFVNREDNEFYDDYQLVDIENWCIDWLQENVDNRIVGFTISTIDLVWYQENTNNSYNYILKKDEVKRFLECYPSSCPRSFYYYDSSVHEYDSKEVDEIIKSRLSSKLNFSSNFNVGFISSDSMKVETGKSPLGAWETFSMP